MQASRLAAQQRAAQQRDGDAKRQQQGVPKVKVERDPLDKDASKDADKRLVLVPPPLAARVAGRAFGADVPHQQRQPAAVLKAQPPKAGNVAAHPMKPQPRAAPAPRLHLGQQHRRQVAGQQPVLAYGNRVPQHGNLGAAPARLGGHAGL